MSRSLIVDTIREIVNFSKDQPGFEKFKNASEEDLVCYHHTLGRHLRNSRSLWDEENPLTQEFREIGIWHADDMSHVLILAAHRILNGRHVELEEIRAVFWQHWAMYGVDPKTGARHDNHKQP